MPSRWMTDLRVARCEAHQRENRCELEAGHDGPHMVGLGEGSNLTHAWRQT